MLDDPAKADQAITYINTGKIPDLAPLSPHTGRKQGEDHDGARTRAWPLGIGPAPHAGKGERPSGGPGLDIVTGPRGGQRR